MPSEKIGCCFVIAPIGDAGTETRRRSDQVLKHVITPAAEACGYDAVRADNISEPGIIIQQVIQHLIGDPVVVADLTERNPNVFYELAIRHALRKPYVQIIQKGERIPFDVAAVRTVEVDHRDLDSVQEAIEEIKRQMMSFRHESCVVESPISAAVDLDILRKSGDPEQRQLAEMLSSVADIVRVVGKLEVEVASIRHLILASSAGNIQLIASKSFKLLEKIIEPKDIPEDVEADIEMEYLSFLLGKRDGSNSWPKPPRKNDEHVT